MDNNNTAMLNVPDALHDALRIFFFIFHSTIYQIPMKWEPSSFSVD